MHGVDCYVQDTTPGRRWQLPIAFKIIALPAHRALLCWQETRSCQSKKNPLHRRPRRFHQERQALLPFPILFSGIGWLFSQETPFKHSAVR